MAIRPQYVLTLSISWLFENYKFPIWAYVYKFFHYFTEIKDLEAGAEKRLMVENTGNLKLISYLFPFQENACMPCLALGRARKFK
jgi:hypothetical protein